MHPLLSISQNMDRFHNSTEIAVEVGGDEDHRFLWSEWDQQHRHKFQWVESCQGRIQYYGDMSLEGQQLSAKCNFLKVNNCVLMLLQPHGRFYDSSQLEKQARVWLGNADRSAITDTRNFHNNHIWEEAKEARLPNNKAHFPYGAKSAVIIEDEYHLGQFVQHATTLFAERQIHCILLTQFDVKEYQLEAGQGTDTKPMYAYKRTDLINGLIVTFFNTYGNYGDRLSLQEKAKQWFPNALRFVSQENIADLFTILGTASIKPLAYQKLVKEMEAQAVPTINLSSLDENDIPDQIVSSKMAIEEFVLESYHQQKNPAYKSPQQILSDRYLIPGLTTMRDAIFPAIKVKMNKSQNKGFKAELESFSVLAYQYAGRILVTLRENGSDDYISLVGSDSSSDIEIGIQGYYGNIHRLLNILDVVTQKWEIEKFQECNEVFIL